MMRSVNPKLISLILGDGQRTIMISSTYPFFRELGEYKCSPVELGSLSLIQFCLVVWMFRSFLGWFAHFKGRKGIARPSCLGECSIVH